MGTDDENEDNSALSIAILAARQALDASNRAESTARAVIEAMNTVAEAMTALTKVIYDAVYEEDDAEDAVASVVVGENSPEVGESSLEVGDKPVFSEMPELSGEVYPEYTEEMDAMRAAGDPDPLVPLMHITPLSDTYPHELSMKVCWCNPSVVSEAGMHIVAHNTADGREKAEGYREKVEGYREKMN